MKVGDLVRIKKEELNSRTKFTPWAQRSHDQRTPMLVIPNPIHWEEVPMENDKHAICVLFENKLRVLTRDSVEIVSE